MGRVVTLHIRCLTQCLGHIKFLIDYCYQFYIIIFQSSSYTMGFVKSNAMVNPSFSLIVLKMTLCDFRFGEKAIE